MLRNVLYAMIQRLLATGLAKLKRRHQARSQYDDDGASGPIDPTSSERLTAPEGRWAAWVTGVRPELTDLPAAAMRMLCRR
jgi:hypothetical protein